MPTNTEDTQEHDLPLEGNTPEVEIKIEDDTPPEDRNRTPLPQNIVEELDKDDLEEYSDKVKKRLSQMKKVWHDERRAKESSIREREEAIRFAQAQADENRKLKERLGVNQRAYLDEVTRSTKNDVDVAKAKLKTAYESGDPEAIANAQEEMTDAKMRLREYERVQPARQQQENKVQQPPQVQAATQTPQPVDPKLQEWRAKNTWFDVDDEMTALAMGVHYKLVREGVDPKSDDYYRKVDTAMRKRFPERFEDEEPQTEEQEKPAPRKAANVVAPATRSTAPKQVRLTPSAVALAKRLGISNEAYAKEILKLENSNG